MLVKGISYPYIQKPRPDNAGPERYGCFRQPSCVSQAEYQQLVTIVAFATPTGMSWVDRTKPEVKRSVGVNNPSTATGR